MTEATEREIKFIVKGMKSLISKGSQQLEPVWLDCEQFCKKENKNTRQFTNLREHADFKHCFGKRTIGSKTFYYINYPKYLETLSNLIVPIAD